MPPKRKTSDYEKFLATKLLVAPANGITEGIELPTKLFPFQKDIVRWALRRGRAAIFSDCGTGKTPMQLAWAANMTRHTKKPVLILAPLQVCGQTIEEGEKFGITVRHVKDESEIGDGLNITNYEKIHHFPDPSKYGAIVLDESSCIKHSDSKTKKILTEYVQCIDYRLACTATPSPNDYMELGNHAEFLGALQMQEMLAMFFTHDGGETSKWRLKGHGVDAFWKWVASWAIALRRPSDLGYSDEGFVLPELITHPIITDAQASDGQLFVTDALTLQERRAARKASLHERVDAAVDQIKQIGLKEKHLIWCNLNIEQDELAKRFGKDCVSISGAVTGDKRIEMELQWRKGDVPILISKPDIFGWGSNWQHCHNVYYVGLSDSYESYYQSVRRCWRFGQKNSVHSFVVTAENEGAVVKNIARKEKQAAEMFEGMVKHMAQFTKEQMEHEIQSNAAVEHDVTETPKWKAILGDCVEELRKIETDSIDFTIFSPPFSSLYTYSNSIADMGNSRTNDEFFEHFAYAIEDLYRVTRPGRLLSFHCMNLPSTLVRDGYIGIKDFRGDLIRAFEKVGFIYHSEVCIWKDPVVAMQRTKARGLLHMQLVKDSAKSRQGIPDYLVTMLKPGENTKPVHGVLDHYVGEQQIENATAETRNSINIWQQYASPVWFDINPSDTLQKASAREDADERHICPLQLTVIHRALQLWTNENDLVLSPFMGIGSEGYEALKMKRRFIGIELKRSYWNQAVPNLRNAEQMADSQRSLFDTPIEEQLAENGND